MVELRNTILFCIVYCLLWPRCSVFSALAQIKAEAVMIIDCQESHINLTTTTGVQAGREREECLPNTYQ